MQANNFIGPTHVQGQLGKWGSVLKFVHNLVGDLSMYNIEITLTFGGVDGEKLTTSQYSSSQLLCQFMTAGGFVSVDYFGVPALSVLDRDAFLLVCF